MCIEHTDFSVEKSPHAALFLEVVVVVGRGSHMQCRKNENNRLSMRGCTFSHVGHEKSALHACSTQYVI